MNCWLALIVHARLFVMPGNMHIITRARGESDGLMDVRMDMRVCVCMCEVGQRDVNFSINF